MRKNQRNYGSEQLILCSNCFSRINWKSIILSLWKVPEKWEINKSFKYWKLGFFTGSWENRPQGSRIWGLFYQAKIWPKSSTSSYVTNFVLGRLGPENKKFPTFSSRLYRCTNQASFFGFQILSYFDIIIPCGIGIKIIENSLLICIIISMEIFFLSLKFLSWYEKSWYPWRQKY